jgi:NAD(P)-dependent dehydrogenase (short-subunit alcohol dehydrogenase family)
MKLNQKIVIITGAASGIGLALATRFVQEGAVVIASDRRQEAGEAAARAIGASFIAANIAEETGVEALVQSVLEQHGRIDLFCSNAGIGLPMDALAPESDWDRIININLKSHVWAARHALPSMLERGEGYFLNTASAAGLLNEIDSCGYGVTKHAAVGYAEWLAFTYHDRGIRVSVLCPEGVHTPMIEQSPYLQRNAISTEAVAEAVVQGLLEERFMITTHPTTLPAFQQKAANYEGFIKAMQKLRGQAMELSRAAQQGNNSSD